MKTKNLTQLGIQCEDCGEVIFSRAHHDFLSCACGKISIDGGFDYCKVSGDSGTFKYVTITFKSDMTQEKLYLDWAGHKDKFGHVSISSRWYSKKGRKLPKYILKIKEAPDCFEPNEKAVKVLAEVPKELPVKETYVKKYLKFEETKNLNMDDAGKSVLISFEKWLKDEKFLK